MPDFDICSFLLVILILIIMVTYCASVVGRLADLLHIVAAGVLEVDDDACSELWIVYCVWNRCYLMNCIGYWLSHQEPHRAHSVSCQRSSLQRGSLNIINTDITFWSSIHIYVKWTVLYWVLLALDWSPALLLAPHSSWWSCRPPPSWSPAAAATARSRRSYCSLPWKVTPYQGVCI